MSFTSLPEELLERILAHTFAPRPSSLASTSPYSPAPSPTTPTPHLLTRSSSTPFPSAHSRTANIRPARSQVPVYSPLLTCSLLARVGTPLLYTHLRLTSASQTALLVHTFQACPDLKRAVRTLTLDGIWSDVYDLVQSLIADDGCRLESFDFLIDAGPGTDTSSDSPLDKFGLALSLLPSFQRLKHITVRKSADAYLTLAGPVRVLGCLSDVVQRWDNLETINIAFRLPSGPRVPAVSLNRFPALHAHPSPIPAVSGASARLVTALSSTPNLKVIHAQLPAVWNTSLLEISTNPSLRAIVLDPSPPHAGAHMFIAQARKHARLDALIRAGTPPPPPAPLRAPAEINARERGGVLPPPSTSRSRAYTTAGMRSVVAFPSAAPLIEEKPPAAMTPHSSSSSTSRKDGFLKPRQSLSVPSVSAPAPAMAGVRSRQSQTRKSKSKGKGRRMSTV
ncbi:hypothetical protein PHLCEN_2v11596 [Hermanssonia centrifuga]|uniref:Uncharacterized protein n=1 Tax=Hermanssonia centrifuga TaxID=98765 RepID=A0A2R6NJK7_9APHY|nr:hypothetical protein PHLCEN_2v11596 [Hermanssonia centrifuga]